MAELMASPSSALLHVCPPDIPASAPPPLHPAPFLSQQLVYVACEHLSLSLSIMQRVS